MLSGKTALVTGSSRGIGRAIALALARCGANVLVCYFQNREAAEETAEAIRALGRESEVFRVNIAERVEIERLFDEVADSVGHLDIFVNNAVSSNFKELADLEWRHWERILSANLSSFFYASQRAMHLMKNRKGRIIALTSVAGRTYFPGYGALAVAKAGIETLARYMAIEWSDRDINANVICGGLVDTEALSAIGSAGMDLEGFKANILERSPEARLGRPEDIAEVALFLCSPAVDWIRGQTIVADGGQSSIFWLGRGADEK